MTARPPRADTGMGVSLIASTVIHLTVFLLLAWYGNHRGPLKIQETYYVDVVNLPVASPRSGSPSQMGSDTHPPPALPQTPDAPLALPAAAKTVTKPQASKQPPASNRVTSSTADSSEFAERMARLERTAEAKQEEAALARLREKVKDQGSGRAGMPGGSGTETGSDYMAYIQSRLKDAFQKTITYSSTTPELTVRIFIDTDGKLSRKKAERSSGDRAFEISVLRAIDLASEKFTPPPGRKIFEGVFVFRPEGITPNKK